ncbi:globin-coupled sensor protein [Asaia bogorensis]|uniref:Methyl-accepting chemotaxis protein n=1 Tax=Asaia bogorensis NBRC 16594 TaxID=1231624 RepID=A0AAN4R018_9PROT|nr:globin-coupled sensor protein [Asaia bogorensis]BAT20547.1 methyl-accepting chemotaxis sensory transducer [Asaia bogorensis NBRC 16594]GBQ78966.1 methyl-accepting chemotaxis protein [Asaia bogorensis NBRC 16594]GEL52029.1 methyl-accepting chemotaxis protein [Asaia bogorensis NBRC 16594]
MTETLLSDLARRQDFIGMGQSDLSSLRSMASLIERELPGVLDGLYRKIRETPRSRAFFTDNAHMERAKEAQLAHWQRIAKARFDEDYVAHVTKIGTTHARIGLEPSFYIGAYGRILVALMHEIIRDDQPRGILKKLSSHSVDDMAGRIESLTKAVLIEIDLTISAYLDGMDQARLRLQEEQTQRAREDQATVETLGQALSALANGDLTLRIADGAVPERLDALRLHFNQAAVTLQKTIHHISNEAVHIGTNATDIGHGADQLSSRTEQQAAAGEEMSAALGQIAGSVKQTAIETRKTEEMVLVAQREAEHADIIRTDTIAAMTAIESSSQEIGGIITIMNEIAFQTNLLALNASVEAARAGDVGRGFAVVAEEVRALSQRSREAAEAIGRLIAQSDAHVRLGVTKVREAGLALQKVMDQVREISSAVTVIASSAQRQSQSIGELNVAMSDLEQTTMQNAGAAEESAEAVKSLVSTADSLAELVSHFAFSDIGHDPASEGTSPPPAEGRGRPGRMIAGEPHLETSS